MSKLFATGSVHPSFFVHENNKEVHKNINIYLFIFFNLYANLSNILFIFLDCYHDLTLLFVTNILNFFFCIDKIIIFVLSETEENIS